MSNDRNVEETEKDREDREKERMFRKRSATPPKPAATTPLPFRPFRTIVILAIIILILLLLIFFYGLGSGGGKLLPGSSGTSNAPLSIPREATPEPENEPGDEARPIIRRELTVSFLPDASAPDRAQEGVCRLDWIDASDETPKTQRIEALHLADFYASLEKALRRWRISLESKNVVNEPVLVIRMAPFPGVGVFRKMKKIAQDIDEKIIIVEQGKPG